MFALKLKNKVYQWVKTFIEKRSYIEVSVQYDKSAYIKACCLHGSIRLEERVRLYKTVISGNVTIGRYSSCWGPNIQILSQFYPIKIGNFCSIARDVTIQEYYHDYQKLTTYYIQRNVFGEKNIDNDAISKGPIEIGHDVWIGTGVQILSGVTIGNGVVVGANAVVTKDVPDYAIVAGSPAEVIKYRFSQERIKELLLLQWWNWDKEELLANRALFDR